MNDAVTSENENPITIPDGRMLKRYEQAIEKWAYREAEKQPNLFQIVQPTLEAKAMLDDAKFLWAAMQMSVRRTVSGKGSALEILNAGISENSRISGKRKKAGMARSTAYKRLHDMGFDSEERMDQFRSCKTFEEVIALSQPLQDAAWKIRIFYEEFRDRIEQAGFGVDDGRKMAVPESVASAEKSAVVLAEKPAPSSNSQLDRWRKLIKGAAGKKGLSP